MYKMKIRLLIIAIFISTNAAFAKDKSISEPDYCDQYENQPENLFFHTFCILSLNPKDTKNQYYQALQYLEPKSGQYNLEKGLALLKPFADIGDPPKAALKMGEYLVQGKAMPPQYEKGIVYLNNARQHGLGQAAFDLAQLFIDGRGIEQSLENAVLNYQFSIDHGYPQAILGYAILYLDNKLTPIDEVKARSILDTEIKRGNKNAVFALNQIDMIETKYKKIEAIPKPDGTLEFIKVRGVNVRQLDAIEGDTDEFVKIHNQSFQNNDKIIAEFQAKINQLPTPYFYEIARRIAVTNSDEALKWLWLARLRMEYDVNRCTNPRAFEVSGDWRGFINEAAPWLSRFATVEKNQAAYEAAKLIDKTLSSSLKPWWACSYISEAQPFALRSQQLTKTMKPVSEWPKIKQETLQHMQKVADGKINS